MYALVSNNCKDIMAMQSSRRHVLAEIRLACELTQKEMGYLVGRSKVLIQKIEQGTANLSADLAEVIGAAFDVDASWLLANDSTRPAVTPRGGAWSPELYELVQSKKVKIHQPPDEHGWMKVSDPKRPELVAVWDSSYVPPDFDPSSPIPPIPEESDATTDSIRTPIFMMIHGMLKEAEGKPAQGILSLRLHKVIDKLLNDFRSDPDTAEAYIRRMDWLHYSQNLKALQIAKKEHDAIWGKPKTKPARPPR
jgi:transcriptional regulator with XRE-family HTH domain